MGDATRTGGVGLATGGVAVGEVPDRRGPRPLRPAATRNAGVPRLSRARAWVVVGVPGVGVPGPRVRLVAGAPVRVVACSAGTRVRPVSRARYAVRRAAAAVVLAGVAAVVVVALGLVADATAAARARATVPAGSAEVSTARGETVRDVARRAVPGADPAAAVERIATDNGLPTAASPLPEGLVLRVPA